MILSRSLHEAVYDHCLNEDFLVTQMEVHETSGEPARPEKIYWLSMAQLMELALLCAGNYADFGQIREAADLMVNPRHREVHINGVWEPVRVRRYEPMTQQFADYAPVGANVAEWLRDNTHLVHVKGPLVPDLYDLLAAAGVFSESYLSSVSLRMQKVLETMAFVMMGQLMDKNYPLSGVHPEEKDFVEKNLCRFHREEFHRIERDIVELQHNTKFRSRFLKNVDLGYPVYWNA